VATADAGKAVAEDSALEEALDRFLDDWTKGQAQ
jgi:hypothetical protein